MNQQFITISVTINLGYFLVFFYTKYNGYFFAKILYEYGSRIFFTGLSMPSG